MCYRMNLQYFGEEGVEPTAAATGTATAGTTAAPEGSWESIMAAMSGEQHPAAAEDAAANAEPAVDAAQQTEVQSQEDGQPEGTPSADPAEAPAQEDPDEQFKALVKGQYKEQYRKATQEMIDKRFKETKNLEKFKSDHEPLLEMLAQQLHVDKNDVDGLRNAITDLGINYEERAYKNGTTPEYERQQEEIRREKESVDAQKRALEQAQAQRQAEEAERQRIEKEYDAFKTAYPDVDVQDALNDSDEMRDKVAHGYSLLDAYRATHFDEIAKQYIENAVNRTKTAVLNDIKANGARAHENAASSQTGATTRPDISKMPDDAVSQLWDAFGTGRNGDILAHK